MQFETIVSGAMQLGVIPILALFLAYQQHVQYNRLLKRMEAREDEYMKWLWKIVKDFGEARNDRGGGGKR